MKTRATAITLAIVFAIVSSPLTRPANAETDRYNFSSCMVRITGGGPGLMFKPGTMKTPRGKTVTGFVNRSKGTFFEGTATDIFYRRSSGKYRLEGLDMTRRETQSGRIEGPYPGSWRCEAR
ncbi:hypothetical protein [Hoeflea sp. BAL378]|uniref:hypothetical protein n=1 Tax=Hoeflea sp. BAL378 TaxID=1547437 RepID=UPI00126A442D|nr:hypothetical protein [Hoeflea sp. BAL378]